MRSTSVSPSAASPASTRLAEARRSVAITGAAASLSTPRHTAVLPSMRISAPIRWSSSTCWKRFSNTVSVTVPTPLATAFRAQNCACMSVGNAGYGIVRISTARGRRPPMPSSIQSGPVRMSAPASRSLIRTASRDSGSARLSRTEPPVIAAATRYVPVSMRSGRIAWFALESDSTPSTRIVLLPAPEICAPMDVRNRARSRTSGSRAAFSSSVSPSASTAAISRFSVPVTVTVSKTMWVPFRRDARARM